MNARLQHVSTLLSQLVAVQVQVKARRRFIARQTQQQVLQSFQRNFAAGDVQVLQAQTAREELLERWRNFFALLRAERVVSDVQMGEMS